jgi:hypothetical protein
LLIHPHTAWQQHTLADAAGLSEGTVSKVVRAHEAEGFVTRHPEDRVRMRDREPLLQAWREGVFHGATKRDSVTVVRPVQAYLDLDTQAERAPEAAEHLRGAVLTRVWSDQG